MKKFMVVNLALVLGLALFLGASCQTGSTNTKGKTEEKQTIKLGYFPNITHAQAIVGMENGTFQEFLGDNVTIEPITFNSGTEEIEALFAGEIDLGYIGPSPSVNGYTKSEGEALRIISGSNSGGAVLVGTPELAVAFKKDGAKALEGKKIASPSQGNTQDISLRHYVRENGLTDKVEIVPIANADQLTMFVQEELDGSWVPEPWGARMIKDGGAELMIDERDLWPDGMFTTTNVIASTEFLDENPDLVKKWLQAQIELTNWINENPEEAQKIVNSEIERLTTKKLDESVLQDAWTRLDITVDPVEESVYTFADYAFEEGFLGATEPDLSNLYDLTILDEITNKKY
ncbi:MAG: aliphatic sulfonate ABC transporter substrate-binding protein [Patescibacteria group bacterium]